MSGTFRTTYWADDGTKTTVNALPRNVLNGRAGSASALLVPDSSPAGYAKFPFAVDANQGFQVAGVPAGPYFLELDRTELFSASCGAGFQTIPVTYTLLFGLSANSPDLDSVTAARADVGEVSFASTQVTLDMTNMDPWTSNDEIRTASSQALGTQRVFLGMPPAPGTTTFSSTFGWTAIGLPEASKNDVVFFYQRSANTVGSGATAAIVRRATKFKRLTDLTVVDGASTSATVPFEAAPQTGSIRANLAVSQFVALAQDVSPAAGIAVGALFVAAAPHSIAYPDMPPNELTTTLLVTPSGLVDADYGTLTYGQFLDPLWTEFLRVSYTFDVQGTTVFSITDFPMNALPAGPILPVLGPPKSPRVNGKDAFAKQFGVGVQPTISWSPPARGNPTSYLVEIRAAALPCADGQSAGVAALIRNGTSFRVPPGILQSGIAYRATITARQAPWDTADTGPFRTGTPFHSAPSVIAQFVP